MDPKHIDVIKKMLKDKTDNGIRGTIVAMDAMLNKEHADFEDDDFTRELMEAMPDIKTPERREFFEFVLMFALEEAKRRGLIEGN
jgi:hypothetical protein